MFFIMEIQKTDDTHVAHLMHVADTRQEADSKYHMVLGAAAISSVPVHSAIILTDEGVPIRHESYIHEEVSDDGIE